MDKHGLTGVTRKIDALGRLVIPKEIRVQHHLDIGHLIEFHIIDVGYIGLKKVSLLNCNVCGVGVESNFKFCPGCGQKLNENK